MDVCGYRSVQVGAGVAERLREGPAAVGVL